MKSSLYCCLLLVICPLRRGAPPAKFVSDASRRIACHPRVRLAVRRFDARGDRGKLELEHLPRKRHKLIPRMKCSVGGKATDWLVVS